MPLQSHFDPGKFTAAKIDNFDHEEATVSGVGESHDTVLLQEDPGGTKDTPNRSDTNVLCDANTFKTELPSSTCI